MAGSVKGLVVQIGGDTSGLQKALTNVNKTVRSLGTELNAINKQLKFDPKNTELLSQKQQVLGEKIRDTSTKLETLKQAQQEAENAMKNGTEINQDNYRALKREIEETERQLAELKYEASDWKKVSDSLNDISKKTAKIGSALQSAGRKLTTSITLPVAALTAAGLTYNAQMQTYQTRLKTLTGSAEEADKIIKQIKKDAAATPFDVAGLTQAESLLISAGLSADASRESILALGNAVSASGGGNEELQRMAVNLQQIKNLGKASSVDIKQFTMAGIDIYGMLSDYTGKSKKELQETKITWEMLNGALLKASKEGGRYFGAMDAQSKTLNGRIATLKDNAAELAGSLTESLLPTVERILKKLTDLVEKFNGLDQGTKDIIIKIALAAAAIGPLLTGVGKIFTAISSISGGLSSLSAIIGKASASMAAAGAEGTTLGASLSSIAGPIGIVIGIVTALIAAIVKIWQTSEEFRNKVMETGQSILQFFQETVMPTFNRIRDMFVERLTDIKNTLSDIWTEIEPFIEEILTTVVGAWETSGKDIMTDLFTVINYILDKVEWIYQNVGKPILNFLKNVLVPAFKVVFAYLSGEFKAWLQYFKDSWSAAKTFLSGIIDFISGVFTGDWSKAWEGIKKIFTGIWNGLVANFKVPLNTIIGGLNTFFKKVSEVKIPDWVPGLGGRSISWSPIPLLAKGGVVNGATPAIIGEAGAEAVIPLDGTLEKYLSRAMQNVSGGDITVNFYPKQMTNGELDRAFNYINRRFGTAY